MAIYDVVLPPGSKSSGVGRQDNVGDVCAQFFADAVSCQQNGGGYSAPPNSVGPSPQQWFQDRAQANVPDNLPLGSKVCRVFTVNPAKRTGGSDNDIAVAKRMSAPSCATVAKYPMKYATGSDVWVGGSYNASQCSRASKIFTASVTTNNGQVGSHSQYAAFATGSILGYGSARQPYNNGNQVTGNAQLFFANTGLPNNYGTNGMSHCLTNYYTGGGTTDASVDLGSLATGTYRYRNVNLSGAVQPGRQVTIIAESVTITGDITYGGGTYASIKDLPYLVVASRGDITVANNVGTLTGTYQTRANFNTCSQPLSTVVGQGESACPTQLRVEGSVIANRLALRRTGGALQNPDYNAQAAEYFNQTPMSILAPYAASSGDTTITTVFEKELPPRY